MSNKLLHTPDGVRDIYGPECAKKKALQQQIEKVFHLYGCDPIETPTFEFFDIFNEDRGSVGSREMFKFFDRDNSTLVLRPDETPAIARCAAKYFPEESLPLHLCYLERTFINNSKYQGRLKEATQMGAELIGDDSCDADAEMIALVIHSLKAAGLSEFQVEIGQVDFFRGLLEEAGLDGETQELLQELIENKNYFGAEELLSSQKIETGLKSLLLQIPELFGSLEQILKVKELTANKRALNAADRLERVHQILVSYGVEEYVSYDLGMLSKYQYYTGLIFKAFTYGTGDYIVTGGRYDKLLEQFGKGAPAIGFAIVVDSLYSAMVRQNIEISIPTPGTMILYEEGARENALILAARLRSSNMAVSMCLKALTKDGEFYKMEAKRRGIRNLMLIAEGDSCVTIINVPTGDTDRIQLSEYEKGE